MPAATATAARRFFEHRYREAGTPARAAGSKAYLKSDLRFYGTTMPDIRGAANDFARSHPDLSRSELRKIVEELWSTDVFELRSLRAVVKDVGACGLARLGRDRQRGGGVANSAATAARLGTRRQLLGPSHRLLAQLWPLSHEAGDFALFARMAAPMLGQREFFIRKAIGWVLREVSKRRPRLVFEFLREHRAEVSG